MNFPEAIALNLLIFVVVVFALGQFLSYVERKKSSKKPPKLNLK